MASDTGAAVVLALLLFLCAIAIPVAVMQLVDQKSSPKKRIACVYAYFEKDAQYKENLRYFLQHGVGLAHVDYFIVVNGECTVRLPETITVVRRPNVGFDFGAYGDVMGTRDFSVYDFVVFLNASVCGPYEGVHYKKKCTGGDWTLPFIAMFEEDASVKLVGTSINVMTDKMPHLLPGDAAKRFHPHVQSMFFVVDRESLAFLRRNDVFNVPSSMPMHEIVAKREVGMSFLVLDHGWNINCLLPGYRGLDYRSIDHQPNAASSRRHGDPYYVGNYFGNTIRPHDVIFLKNTRY